MSPRARGAYRPGRQRSEILKAVAGVLTVLAVTVGLILVFKPASVDSDPVTPPFTLPPDLPTTTAPGGTPTTVPATTPTTAAG
jgi:hypothetical protein